MGVRTRFTVADGNTVPYPPLFDGLSRNRGYLDTRGRPELVDDIPEALESPALCQLLKTLAAPDARFISLGCDVGQHVDTATGAATRYVAGGYVQICPIDHEGTLEALRILAKGVEQALKDAVGVDRWEARFELRPVALKFEPETFDSQSVWIWFFAKAISMKKAVQSRERLLMAMNVAVDAASAEATARD